MTLVLAIIFAACPLRDSWNPRAYVIHGTCEPSPSAICRAAMWIDVECTIGESWRSEHRVLYVFEARYPTLREWAQAQNLASVWLAAWREARRT